MRRARRPRWALAAVVVTAALAGHVAWLLQPAASQELTAQEELGERLYVANCSSCHGLEAEGTEDGPDLFGAGPASVDFMLSTGRMPLNQPNQQPVRQEPKYSEEEIAAIVSFVTAIAPGGPPIPIVDADAGDLQLGQRHRLRTGLAEQVEQPGGVVERVHAELIRRGPDGSYPAWG